MSTEINLSTRGQDKTDWLDSLLRESRPNAIEDEGFSAQVMQRLPLPLSVAKVCAQLKIGARKERRFEYFTLVGALVGSVLAYWGSSGSGPDELSYAIAALLDFRPVPVQVLAPWLASMFSALVLAYVMQKD